MLSAVLGADDGAVRTEPASGSGHWHDKIFSGFEDLSVKTAMVESK